MIVMIGGKPYARIVLPLSMALLKEHQYVIEKLTNSEFVLEGRCRPCTSSPHLNEESTC